MDLVPGEYVFTCLECEGDGSIQVITEDEEAPDGVTLTPELCPDCRGEGVEHMDEEEAAEMISLGHTPLRTPSA